MRANEFQPKRRGSDLASEHITNREKIALGLGHFLAFNNKMTRVKPDSRKRCVPVSTTTLRNFALVMRKNIVLAAGVQIDFLAKKCGRHRTAFKMPSRISSAPRRIPFHHMRSIGFPQHEIRGMTLERLVVCRDSFPRTFAKCIKRIAGEFAIRRKRSNVEIDHAVACDICVIAGDEFFNKCDHLRDALRWARHERWIRGKLLRNFQAKRSRIIDESIGIEVCNGKRIARVDVCASWKLSRFLRLCDTPTSNSHLVFAATIRIRIVSHVTDIGNVHHVTDGITDEFQSAAQHIGIEKRAKVANVRIVIDRWPAGIKSHHSPSGVDWRESFSLTSQRVMERE